MVISKELESNCALNSCSKHYKMDDGRKRGAMQAKQVQSIVAMALVPPGRLYRS